MERNGIIAVGFDGSAASWTALDYAATEAVLRGLNLRLVHALLEPADYAETALIKPVEDAPTEARRLLAFASNYLTQQYGNLGVQLSIGARAAGDLLVSESHAATLVVVGRRGRGRLPTVIGSVSAHVAAHSKCTVLVVGATPRSPSGPVVVGVDVTTPAPSAVSFAFDAADRHGTDLVACYVWAPTPPPIPFGPSNPDRPHDLESARRMLDEALADGHAAYPDVQARAEVVRGADPAAQLLELAADASLVVVGCREETGFQRLVHGSVSHALIHHTASPVVVTHTATTGVLARA